MWHPVDRRRESETGTNMERGNLHCDVKREVQAGSPCKARVARHGVEAD